MTEINEDRSVTSIPVTEIEVESTIQPRQNGLDGAHVAVLRETGPEAWPPLVVVERDGRHVLIDGHHRLEAALQLELVDLPCECRPAPDDHDLRTLAFAMNKEHGKPLTSVDRRAEAARLLKCLPEIADRELAERCGLDHKTIGKIRKELEVTGEIPQFMARKGRDGKVRPVPSRHSTVATGAQDVRKQPRTQDTLSSGATSKQDPSLAALNDIVDRLCGFLTDHAGDELGAFIADAILERWSGPEQREHIEALQTLAEQLTIAGNRLTRHDATAPTSIEKVEAA